MHLTEIFAKPIDRNIPRRGFMRMRWKHCSLRLRSMSSQKEIAKGLGVLFDAYTDYQGANGVWISGFFGFRQITFAENVSVIGGESICKRHRHAGILQA